MDHLKWQGPNVCFKLPVELFLLEAYGLFDHLFFFFWIRVSVFCLLYWIYLAPTRTSSGQNYDGDKACLKYLLIFSTFLREVCCIPHFWGGERWFIARLSSCWSQYTLFSYHHSHLCSHTSSGTSLSPCLSLVLARPSSIFPGRLRLMW